jgi:hypothetical protein
MLRALLASERREACEYCGQQRAVKKAHCCGFGFWIDAQHFAVWYWYEAATVDLPQIAFVTGLHAPLHILKAATRMEDNRPNARPLHLQHPEMRQWVPLRIQDFVSHRHRFAPPCLKKFANALNAPSLSPVRLPSLPHLPLGRCGCRLGDFACRLASAIAYFACFPKLLSSSLKVAYFGGEKRALSAACPDSRQGGQG